MRLTIALVLATAAAYAFSFTIDLLFGGLSGVYPSTAFLPVVTWSVISAVAIVAARSIATNARWLALPYVAFGAIATLGAFVGSHPHSFGVAGAMFLHAYIVWRGTSTPSSTGAPAAPEPARVDSGAGWAKILSRCDLAMARNEIAEMLKQLSAEATRQGGTYMFKQELSDTLEAFVNNPTTTTASALLEIAPSFSESFEACSPGGRLYETNRHLQDRGL